MPTVKINSSKSATASIKYARDSCDVESHQKKLAYEGGITCDPTEAELDFSITRKLYRKTNSIQAHNIILSFAAETDIKTAKQFTAEFCQQINQKLGGGFQIVFYGHQNTKHLHSHIVINSVNLDTGRKYHLFNDIYQFRQLSDQLAQKFGLELPQTSYQRFDKIEREMAKKKIYYWKTDLKHQIQTIIQEDHPQSEMEFNRSLKRHHIALYHRQHNHKPIYMYEFTDQENKTHKAKDFKLGGTDFEYRTLQLGFKSNAELAKTQEGQRTAIARQKQHRKQLENKISGLIGREYSIKNIDQAVVRSELFAREFQQKITELMQKFRIQEFKQSVRKMTDSKEFKDINKMSSYQHSIILSTDYDKKREIQKLEYLRRCGLER